MKVSSFFPGSLGGAVRPAIFVLALAAVSAVSAQAQTTTITPYSRFEYSTITSSDDSVNASRVPAIDANGVIHYWDVSLVFDVDAEGNLTLAAGYPTFVKSISPISAGFKAGKYYGPSTVNGGNDIITVSGPGISSGGSTIWTSATATGASLYTDPNSAVWYVVSSLSNNPLAARLSKAGITSTKMSYGFGSGPYWCSNSLLGFSQVGNSVTISDFTNYQDACIDQATPYAQITYIYKP